MLPFLLNLEISPNISLRDLNKCQPLNLRGFRCWVRYPFVQRLCLIAKEMEEGVTITCESKTLPGSSEYIHHVPEQQLNRTDRF